MSPAEIETLQALLDRERAGLQPDGSRSLTSRKVADDALGKAIPMCEIKGPYKDRKKWRVRVIDTLTAKQFNHIFDTEEEARAAIPKLEAEYRRPVGVQLFEALAVYETDLMASRRKATSRGPETAIGRIRSVLVRKATADTDLAIITGDIGIDIAKQLWTAYATRTTHSKRPPSPDSKLNTLAALRSFWAFLLKASWAKVDPFAAIEVKEPRRKGKPSLKKDSAKAFWDLALDRAKTGDEGALLALLGLGMGLRASEIISRTVNHLDAGGTELIIDDAKSEAGNRTLMIPEPLQPLVKKLAKGKKQTDLLFEGRNRHSVYREVAKLVADAGVERVTPHGLRRTASNLAQAAGMIGTVVAASLGHESYETTKRYYTDPASPANAQIARVAALLQ